MASRFLSGDLRKQDEERVWGGAKVSGLEHAVLSGHPGGLVPGKPCGFEACFF